MKRYVVLAYLTAMKMVNGYAITLILNALVAILNTETPVIAGKNDSHVKSLVLKSSIKIFCKIVKKYFTFWFFSAIIKAVVRECPILGRRHNLWTKA